MKMRANYHHLTNWGTNSVFVVVGEKKPTPFFSEDGTVTMKNALELGITIDERIADGYYFANSLRLVRRLLAEPELLDLPIMSPVEY
jgi:pyruvate/2-oxoglutarate dehydrogenase complex dihydrolipoamide acyltransferase (E2) component